MMYRCIHDGYYVGTKLTIGKIYIGEIIKLPLPKTLLSTVDDNGQKVSVNANYFIDVVKDRDNKLKQLGL